MSCAKQCPATYPATAFNTNCVEAVCISGLSVVPANKGYAIVNQLLDLENGTSRQLTPSGFAMQSVIPAKQTLESQQSVTSSERMGMLQPALQDAASTPRLSQGLVANTVQPCVSSASRTAKLAQRRGILSRRVRIWHKKISSCLSLRILFLF